MKRREFLKKAVIAGTAISIPSGLDEIIGSVFAAETADLAVVTGPSPEKITRAAIEALGGMSRFVSRGDVVVVKPNMAWDRTPELAANSNPEVVATVVQMCLEAEAKKVTVFDRPVNDARRCYVQSGIADAVRRLGVEVPYMDERKFRDMSIKGEALKSWPIYTDAIEADKVINVPIAKHHGLAKLTMSMKNWMGVMGGSRNKIHQKLDDSLVDLARFIRPDLTVLDAVRILLDNGPQGGDIADVRKTDTVIAGVDQVAIDAYGATLFGVAGKDLGYVRKGHESGFGSMNLSRMVIRKLTVLS